MNRGFKALGRLKGGVMNNTEKLYVARLELRKHIGEVLWYEFEAINLRLGDNLFYKPDFLVMTSDRSLQVHEVKGGYVTDDAIMKIKAASAKFPFDFYMFKYQKKEWEEISF